MRAMIRGVVFGFVLGLYRAWEPPDGLCTPAGIHVRHRPVDALHDPARCFFWGLSSMAN